MKPQTILFFTLFYLITYLGISYLISYAWNLEISFLELLTIGLIFSTLLIVLLVFDVPEKIFDKLTCRKPKIIIYNNDENEVLDSKEETNNFFEKEKDSLEVNNEKERNAELIV